MFSFCFIVRYGSFFFFVFFFFKQKTAYEISLWLSDVCSSDLYHVLVNDGYSQTYVAEQNLESDKAGGPINHPEVRYWFETLTPDGYNIRMRKN